MPSAISGICRTMSKAGMASSASASSSRRGTFAAVMPGRGVGWVPEERGGALAAWRSAARVSCARSASAEAARNSRRDVDPFITAPILVRSGEALAGALTRLRELHIAVPRLGIRMQRVHQSAGRGRHFVHRSLEDGLVGARRAGRAAQLANELERRGADLVLAG